MSLYIDLHVLQTVPPSNINRDDTGSPKTAVFGGVRRARVSSQAWKRAIRAQFQQTLDCSELGERTFTVVQSIATRIAELDSSLADRASDLATKAVQAAGVKVKPTTVKHAGDETEERMQTGALLFASRPQIDAMARLVIENPDKAPGKKKAKEALTKGVTVDVALFGRMIADDPDMNIDACAQVAHALSVHGVDTEYDYFTAVDDNAPEGNAGAGMIGTIEFNSSTLYRYATVNATEFERTLGSKDAAAKGIRAFIKAFITSMPTGKQNTFANRTVPELALLLIRDDQPANLVGAFEEPVQAIRGRARAAAQALLKREDEIEQSYGSIPVVRKAVALGAARDVIDQADGYDLVSLDDLVEAAGLAVGEAAEE